MTLLQESASGTFSTPGCAKGEPVQVIHVGHLGCAGSIPEGEGRCGGLIGKEDALKVLEKVVSFSKNFEVSAFLSAEDLSLTRYYENHIHQNLRRHNQTLTVRVVRGKRSGVASTNLLDDGSLRWAVQSAYENMEVAGEDKDFVGLPKPLPIAEVNGYLSATANLKPKDRAAAGS